MADYSVTYDQLDALLQGLDPNTADAPYEIEITTATEEWLKGYNQAVQGTLQYVLKQNSSKYVSLTWGNSAKQVLSLFSDTAWMFWACSSLVSIDASALPRVAYYTFAGCSSLVSVDITGVSLNKDIHGLFQNCSSLVSVVMTGNTNVTRTENMFYRCTSLQSVNVSGLDSVSNARNMFEGCINLSEIHGWQIPLTADMGGCFTDCRSLEHIYTNDTPSQESSWHAWDIRKDTANNQSTVTVYNPDGTSNSVSVPSAGTYTMKVTDKVDELLFSPSEEIPAATIQKMLQTKAPITAKDALDPTKDNFMLWAKDRASARTNVTTDVIEEGNKLPPTSEAVRAAIGQMGLIMYPVGSIYMSVNSINPENIFGGTWERLPAGVFIRNAGGDANPVGEVQNEGLPNITGSLYGMQQNKGGGTSGAFSRSGGSGNNEGTHSGFGSYDISFNARSSNSIYGASSHVTTYNTAVYIWKRIA